ncbi:hypothetical protein D3C73_780020 [compost metagenome]
MPSAAWAGPSIPPAGGCIFIFMPIRRRPSRLQREGICTVIPRSRSGCTLSFRNRYNCSAASSTPSGAGMASAR